MGRTRRISDRDWDQLMTVAAGFLTQTGGDFREAMRRALSAHADLIAAIKAEDISASTTEGKITLIVPEGGGIAIRADRN